MKSVEVYARSLEEAINDALNKLDKTIDEVEIEIMEVSSKGLFGILGGKQTKVKATVKEESPAAENEIAIEKIVTEITEAMGLKAQVLSEEKDDYLKITLAGENMGVLIGRRGETLDALQYLVNLIANKNAPERKKIIIDAEGYRKRREDTLTSLAYRLAERVKRTKQQVVLEPMNPQERRIIHTALQNDRHVQTLSEGQDPYRKVVISLKNK